MNRPTLMQRIDRRLNARRNGEGGLALLDVLLGMAIFALIAVIAVQAMGKFRERAHITAVTSDLKQVEAAVMAAMTQPGAEVWDVTPAAMRTAPNRDWVWWMLGAGAAANAAGLSAAEIKALGINLTNPDTTKVVIVPVARMVSVLRDTESTGDEFLLCVHDTKTGKYAKKREAFRYESSAGWQTAPELVVAGTYEPDICNPVYGIDPS